MADPLSGAPLESLNAAVLSSVAAGIAAVDDSGVQTYVNPAFAEMVGWPIEELVGARAPYAYWPPEEIERIGAALADTVKGAPPEDGYELRFIRRDGSRFDVLVSPRPLRAPDGEHIGWVASVKDLTIRKELERARDRAAAHQRFLAEASEVLASSLEYEKTLAAIARHAVPHFADYCLVDLIDDDGSIRRVEVADSDAKRAELLRTMGRRWPADMQMEIGPGYVARTGRSSLISEVTDDVLRSVGDDPERLAAIRALGVRSTIAAPIVARGRVLGALSLGSVRPDRRFDAVDLATAESLGQRAGLAIDNARLYAAEQRAAVQASRSAHRIERLQSLTAALSTAATLEDVATAALQHGTEALGATGGAVTLLERDALHQRRVAHYGAGAAPRAIDAGEVFPIGAPDPANDALRERRVIRLTRAEYAQGYPELAAAGAPFEFYVAAPLEIEGRAIGCIDFRFPEPREFAQRDIDLVVAVSRQASLAFERARLFESELDARARSEEANLAKSRFLGTMSHELRTPLNAVLGFIELLHAEIDGPLNEAQQAKLQRVAGASQHLMSVIDEILTFTRLDAQHELVRLAECDLGETVREAVSLLEAQAHKTGIRLELALPAGVRMPTDAGKLRQITLNLFGNALKFTERGTIGVELVDGDVVTLSVWDTGSGIPADQHERIFEPFAQIDGSTTRRAGGTGLGLTVSRGLARLLGGDLTVSSRPDGGSRFELTLPRA